MIKRPVCLTALVMVLFLLVLPSSLWMREEELPEETSDLTGEVARITPDGGPVYLQRTNLADDGYILVYFDSDVRLAIGNRICIRRGYTLKKPEEPANPGQFDARTYYASQRVAFLCYAREAEILDGSVRSGANRMYRLQEALSALCARVFGEEYAGELKAMILGNRSDLDTAIRNIYQKSGAGHLLVVSGIHVSTVSGSLYRLLRRLKASYLVSVGTALALLLFYGMLTGMSTSTTRAVVMSLLSMTADLLGRSYDMLTALSLAAILLLAEQPLLARSASFLLSFGAVLGIGLVYPALLELWPTKRRLPQALLLSQAVQLMTLPLTAYFYYELPTYQLAVNLLVIPLMSVLLPVGILALALGALHPALALPPAFVACRILDFYRGIGRWTLGLPGSVYVCGQPRIGKLVLYYLGLALFLLWRARVRRLRAEELAVWEAVDEEPRREKNLGRKRWLTFLGLSMLSLMLLVQGRRGFSFTMLDVGQGDGLFLRTAAGTTVLIDGGSSSISGVGTYRILPCLKSQGVGELSYVIVTHTDADHISGVQELLEDAASPGGIRIGALMLSIISQAEEAGQDLLSRAEKAGIPVVTVGDGMVLRDSSMTLTCLHPARTPDNDDTNGQSVVLRLDYQNFSMMLTGDLEAEGEQEILSSHGMASCDVLKAGHHGSKTSSSEAWLSALSPGLTLISCGEDNRYGHPHRETLERIEDVGSAVLTTPENGAITIRSDGKSWSVTGYRKTKKDSL